MPARILSRVRREDGQGLVEYALILVLVAVALVLALQAFTGGLLNAFSYATSQVVAAGS